MCGDVVMKLYAPKNKWLNDPKVFYAKGKFHLFYLQGKRVKTWEKISRQRESYGHAISDDCLIWKQVEDIVRPGEYGQWDDKGVWTGDIIYRNGLYYLLYTGVCYKDTIQRLGLAVSKDLIHWEKYPGNPVSEPDPKYYLNRVTYGYPHVRWSDPSFFNIDSSEWTYVYLCAQLKNKVWNKMGCIGLIRSKDMIHWEAMPPVYTPGKEVYHEVPQVIKYKNKYILFFGSKEETEGFGCSSCIKCMISDNPFYWKRNAKVSRIIGGKPRAEYTTCVYKRKNRYELIHLTYEETDKDPKGYIRGRVSLPKQVHFKNDFTPYLFIREDLKPKIKENSRFFQEFVSGIKKGRFPSWKIAKDKIICLPDGKVTTFLLGKIFSCSLQLYIERKGNAQVGILAGLTKSFTQGKCITFNSKNHLEVINLGDNHTLDYGVLSGNKNKHKLTLIFLGKHIEIYVDNIYVGTTFSLKEHTYLGLKIFGKGTIILSKFGIENLGFDEN